MTSRTRAWAALATLGLILAITASWWALALWPIDASAPEWLVRTRAVCFGSTSTGLPNAGGWVLLVAQPLGMLVVLGAAWPRELRAGFALAMARVTGQVIMGTIAAALVAGLSGVAVRVAGADGQPFSAGSGRDVAAELTRVDDTAPELALVDQQGRTVTLEAFRGRPVILTFAYAHCETVCPLVVADVLAAERQLADLHPAVLFITLDPWRDTPSRLEAVAAEWALTPDARVLSGAPETVERTLNAWRVPRVRNEKTGDLSHPTIVYILDPDGRIAYVVGGNADTIAAAVRGL
jgi:protein SCO1